MSLPCRMPCVGLCASPEHAQQFLITHRRRIEHDQHDFAVASGTGAHLFLVGRVRRGASRAYPTAVVNTPVVCQKRRSAPQKQPMPKTACRRFPANGPFSGCPLTKCVGGTRIASVRPGNASSARGNRSLRSIPIAWLLVASLDSNRIKRFVNKQGQNGDTRHEPRSKGALHSRPILDGSSLAYAHCNSGASDGALVDADCAGRMPDRRSPPRLRNARIRPLTRANRFLSRNCARRFSLHPISTNACSNWHRSSNRRSE